MTAARLAIIGAGLVIAARNLPVAPRDQRAEDALDAVEEGISVARSPDGARGTARWKRTIRLGAAGPGLTLDFAALGRLRVSRAS